MTDVNVKITDSAGQNGPFVSASSLFRWYLGLSLLCGQRLAALFTLYAHGIIVSEPPAVLNGSQRID